MASFDAHSQYLAGPGLWRRLRGPGAGARGGRGARVVLGRVEDLHRGRAGPGAHPRASPNHRAPVLTGLAVVCNTTTSCTCTGTHLFIYGSGPAPRAALWRCFTAGGALCKPGWCPIARSRWMPWTESRWARSASGAWPRGAATTWPTWVGPHAYWEPRTWVASLTQGTRVQSALDDKASNICQALNLALFPGRVEFAPFMPDNTQVRSSDSVNQSCNLAFNVLSPSFQRIQRAITLP